jgi:hypothetical protein
VDGGLFQVVNNRWQSGAQSDDELEALVFGPRTTMLPA